MAAGAAGVELVTHGVLPGKQELDQLDGACSVAGPRFRFSGVGHTESGSFSSRARRRTVGYTVAWPPGAAPGTPLPLVVMLHGYGGNHTTALSDLRPWEAVALVVDGRPLPPMAMVTVDGGGGYWNPHPHDDPMAMVISELIPMCQRMNLGRSPHKIGTMGISMGGYGALLLAEKYPDLIRAVAAISPAIWTSYDEARSANPGAYATEADFVASDAVTHAGALAGTPVRVASGNDDPFHPGVVALDAVTAEFSHRGVVGRLPHGILLQCPRASVSPIPRKPPVTRREDHRTCVTPLARTTRSGWVSSCDPQGNTRG